MQESLQILERVSSFRLGNTVIFNVSGIGGCFWQSSAGPEIIRGLLRQLLRLNFFWKAAYEEREKQANFRSRRFTLNS